jgi:hypothetical protein
MRLHTTLGVESVTYIIAGPWNSIFIDCVAPRSALPVVTRPSKAVGIIEQLVDSLRENIASENLSNEHTCL